MSYRAGIGTRLARALTAPEQPSFPHVRCDGCGLIRQIETRGCGAFPPRWFLDRKPPPRWSGHREDRPDGTIDREDYCPDCTRDRRKSWDAPEYARRILSAGGTFADPQDFGDDDDG